MDHLHQKLSLPTSYGSSDVSPQRCPSVSLDIWIQLMSHLQSQGMATLPLLTELNGIRAAVSEHISSMQQHGIRLGEEQVRPELRELLDRSDRQGLKESLVRMECLCQALRGLLAHKELSELLET